MNKGDIVLKVLEVLYKGILIVVFSIILVSCSQNNINNSTKDFIYRGTDIKLYAWSDRIIKINAEQVTFSAGSSSFFLFVNEKANEKVTGVFTNTPLGYSGLYFLAEPKMVSGGEWILTGYNTDSSYPTVRIQSEKPVTVIQTMVSYPWSNVGIFIIVNVIVWIIVLGLIISLGYW